MSSEIKSIRRRFLLLVIIGLLLVPLAGLAGALVFELTSLAELQSERMLNTLGLFTTAITLWAFLHFSNYFNPLANSSPRQPIINGLSAQQQIRLSHFTRDYWSFCLLYALALPALFYLVLDKSIAAAPGEFLQFLILRRRWLRLVLLIL